MNQLEYLTQHCIPTGWQTIRSAFYAWRDLMTGNYEEYALLSGDDPYEECVSWFWQLLGEDNVYSKAFLESLQELIRRVDAGEVEMIPFDHYSDLLEDFSDGDV